MDFSKVFGKIININHHENFEFTSEGSVEVTGKDVKYFRLRQLTCDQRYGNSDELRSAEILAR